MKRKDALTDAVEFLKDKDEKEPQDGPQQVVDSDGELITLGQDRGTRTAAINKKKSLKLTPGLVRAIEEGIEAGFAGFQDRIVDAVKEVLKEASEEFKRNKS